jgi:transposase
MESIGIDVHKNQSSVCISTADGTYVERKIRTDEQRFAAVLKERRRARVLIEASTESEWVAQCVERLGHEVIVADPNYAPMYGQRNRRVKTDRRDARALADACRVGAYRPAHRLSKARREQRAELVVRAALVRTRARYITVIGTLLRREGIRVRTGAARTFVRRLEGLDLPSDLAAAVGPLRALLVPLHEQLTAVEARLAHRVAGDDVMRRLETVPGVGSVSWCGPHGERCRISEVRHPSVRALDRSNLSSPAHWGIRGVGRHLSCGPAGGQATTRAHRTQLSTSAVSSLFAGTSSRAQG